MPERRPSEFLAHKQARRSSAAVYNDTVSASPQARKTHEVVVGLRFAFIIGLLLIIILSLLDVIPLMDTVGDRVVKYIRDLGNAGYVVYIIISAAFVIICVPNSLLALSGGYIYEHTGKGFLVSFPGIMLGSVLSFMLGRLMFKDWLEDELRGYMKFHALSQASEDHGYKVVFFGRLSPLPSGLLNYAFSISGLTFFQYFVASAIGMVPICVGYSKVGSDFYTFFETDELQTAVNSCTASAISCCAAYKDNALNTTEYDSNSTAVGCAIYEIFARVETKAAEDETEPECTALEMLDVDPLVLAQCLEVQSAECSFEVIESEAADLECRYNDNECFGGTEASNNSCLKELNNAELWPKVVLPLSLFLTLVFVGYFGNRALGNAGLLQISYNLDRQKELLLAEKSILADQSAGEATA